ncbi:MAG: type II toxin-antitoxin system RelE/ParE family toxin [Lachnospiraceae bacterium]|nr:type II toxin-antitoxin system RelE/ParE family toxin [Lachnospiraceae bacterium]
MSFTIEPYETENGKIPVNDFIHSLDTEHKAKVRRNLKRLEVNGNMLRMPFSKPLRDGIFELRTQFKDEISRVCYFFYFGKKIILTHGFIKKTEETPQEEINTAIRYKKDYEKRFGGNK